MKIGDICEFKINFPDADFWLIRKGNDKTVGTPTRNFSTEHIGVKIIDTNQVVPEFLFYMFQFLQQKGDFVKLSRGTLNLKHISISDIKDIPVFFKN